MIFLYILFLKCLKESRMPIFEFKCLECGHLFERICKTDQDRSTCPECGDSAQRLVSVTAACSSSCELTSGFT